MKTGTVYYKPESPKLLLKQKVFALRLEVDASIANDITKTVDDLVNYYEGEITRVRVQRNEFEAELRTIEKQVRQLKIDNAGFANYINRKNDRNV